MSEQAWALVPGEERFVSVQVGHPAHRFDVTPRLSLRPIDEPIEMPAMRTIVAWHQRLALPLLGWRGVVYVADEDKERLLDALRVAEGLLLFLRWLCAAHSPQTPAPTSTTLPR